MKQTLDEVKAAHEVLRSSCDSFQDFQDHWRRYLMKAGWTVNEFNDAVETPLVWKKVFNASLTIERLTSGLIVIQTDCDEVKHQSLLTWDEFSARFQQLRDGK